MFLRHSQRCPPSNSPSPLRTCQIWLSSTSRMNRQRPISLPSFFLTTPRNHLLAIFLTSLMTDRLLSAFPVPVRFLLPLLYSSLHSVLWQSSAMCIRCPESCASGVKGARNMSPEGCCRIYPAFVPSELIWGEILRNWMVYEQHCLTSASFGVLLFAVFLSPLMKGFVRFIMYLKSFRVEQQGRELFKNVRCD